MSRSLGARSIVLSTTVPPGRLESTAVDCTSDTPVVLRPGGVTSEQIDYCWIRRRIGRIPNNRLPRHAAKPLCAQCRDQAERYIGRRRRSASSSVRIVFQHRDGTEPQPDRQLQEAAPTVHDVAGADAAAGRIAAADPDRGLGRAIGDRLQRAAAPKTSV